MARSSSSRSAASGKNKDLVALGKRIRELRDAAGLTQEGLADAGGLHWSYIGQVERGERNLSYQSLVSIARGLDTDLSELLKGIG
jgi:transcriptional regulator with XRE-family HTH domain